VSAFPKEARAALADERLRANMHNATQTIREKRARAVAELPDWEELREAGRAIKANTLRNLDAYLVQFESAAKSAGAHVHWARDATEANAIVAEIVHGHGVTEVVKMKSLTTDEIGLNDALARQGISALETDFAELILQLDGDWPSHILVPAAQARGSLSSLPAREVPRRPDWRERRELRDRRDGHDLHRRV
jgi:L-lactate dehydrogenase complex protein LldF